MAICLSSVEFCPAKLRKKAKREAGVIHVGQRTLPKIGLQLQILRHLTLNVHYRSQNSIEEMICDLKTWQD